MKTALIAGASGLIGAQLLHLLLADGRYNQVIALTRKDLAAHPKLLQVKFDETFPEFHPTWRIDDVYCCLGTTMAKAGSEKKFYQVDFTYPLEMARRSLALAAKQFLIVTALGAKPTSPVYYNRIKGEVEEAVSALGFSCLHIFRPSLLLGDRTENRKGEEAAKFFYRIFGFMIPTKYKAIDSAKVAKAMHHFAWQDQKGIFIHESRQLQDF